MPHPRRLYLVSFTEGASVMAAEIAGARILTPFFGGSLYVWSSVMAITLAGLAGGYFMGGRWSRGEQRGRTLLYVLLMASVCLFSMTILSRLFYAAGAHLPLVPAVVLSTLVLLFPVMFCMGAASPLIISILTTQAGESGANSGRIYAISTLGGILSTFLCGFYLLPVAGVRLTLIGFALVLALASLLLLKKPYPGKLMFLLLLIAAASAYSFVKAPKNPYLVYEEEGIQGKLEIREEPSRANPSVSIRKLLINTIVQTEMDTETKHSVSDYVRLLESNVSFFPPGKALVLGLGGGVVANMFSEHGYKVTGVEFDQRIIHASKRFFYLDPAVKTVADDARHFIEHDSGTYALVLFDIFKAEEQPAHVITRESLRSLKQRLDSNALVLVNTHGYLEGTKGLGTQCLLATLRESGFYLKICTSSEDEAYRNLLIVASLKPFKDSFHHELYPWIISDDSMINTDDAPLMELLNAPANQEWRSNYIRHYILNH